MDFTEANMLYLETPAGVGFSYSIDTTGYDAVNDAITGGPPNAFTRVILRIVFT